MFLATANEQKCWDESFAEITGLSTDFLMEEAAQAMALYCELHWQSLLVKHGAIIFCGHGHNGGDGYALARILASHGYPVQIYEWEAKKSRHGIVALNRQACLKMDLPLLALEKYSAQPGLHIDAIYGTGYRIRTNSEQALLIYQEKMKEAERIFAIPDAFSKPATLPLSAKLTESDNHSGDFALLAVDIPSGLEADTARGWQNIPLYDAVLFLGQAKLCLTEENLLPKVKKWQVLPLSIPRQAYQKYPPRIWRTLFEPSFLYDLWPCAPNAAHKGSFGQVGILAGSEGMCGAGLLALEAALISGAGRVYAALPQPALAAALTRCPAALVQSRPTFSDKEQAQLFMQRFLDSLGDPQKAVCLFGPGLANERFIEPLLEALLRWPGQPLLDASALQWIAQTVENMQLFINLCRQRHERGWPVPVLTPHVGEYQALYRTWLLKQTDRANLAAGMNCRLAPERPNGIDERIQAALRMAEDCHCAIYYKSAHSFMAWHSTPSQKTVLERYIQAELQVKLPPSSTGIMESASKEKIDRRTVEIPSEAFVVWLKKGTNALARAGSGDILAGLAAGLMARFAFDSYKHGTQAVWAILNAAYLCGQVAEEFTRSHSEAYFGIDVQMQYLQNLLKDLMQRGEEDVRD